MATTTNYAWETPDDTDLVKDGASAIRTLGSSIDTTTKALNPSTTLGDIEYRSATANTNTRLPIGTSGQLLAVNGSGVPAWTTPSGSSASWTLLSTTSLSGTSTSITGLSGYNQLMFLVRTVGYSSNSQYINITFNSDTAANYNFSGLQVNAGAAPTRLGQVGLNDIKLAGIQSSGANGAGSLYISGANTTNKKTGNFTFGSSDSAGAADQQIWGGIVYDGTSVISSIQFFSQAGGTFDQGTVLTYGSVA